MTAAVNGIGGGILNMAGAGKAGRAEKPTWNPNQSFEYLEDMDAASKAYQQKATAYYKSELAAKGEGALSVDELKQEIGEYFPDYTLVSSEPKLTQGKHYLYIDDSQMKKMAEDADYRAKVYGLIAREHTGVEGYTLRYSDGKNVTAHLTGSVFSLSEKNKKYAGADGIPYLGSCMNDHPFSSSDSHAKVRSMSFIYDNIDPAKSAAKDRAKAKKSGSPGQKTMAERLEAKRLQKRQERKQAAKELDEKRLEKQREARKEQKENAVKPHTGFDASA